MPRVLGEGERRIAGFVRPPSSLRARLALWYMLVVGLTLFCFGAVVFVATGAYVFNARDTTLRERAALLATLVRMDNTGMRFSGNSAFPIERGTAAYLFDAHGRLVGQLRGSAAPPPQPGVTGALAAGRNGFHLHGKVRIYLTILHDGRGRVRGAVQVAQAGYESILGLGEVSLAARLFLAIPILLIIGAVTGLLLAGRALRPIDRITRTAQAIEAGNLQGRLGLTPRNDEVGRLAATFDGMLDRLEGAFAQQRQFVADASHELRTPLTIIQGDLAVLLRRPRAPTEYAEVMRTVADEVMRLSRLTEDLLTLARADSGQAELAHEFLYLDALVETVTAGGRRLAEAKDVAVETEVERNVAILGDPARLHQLLLNLLGNAVKYTPMGGRIRVTLARKEGLAYVGVEDTGIGIAPEDLPHVFDRFYRADEARSRADGGAGLGLAIARWCVERHGGRITVESRPGAGSRFTVVLPLAPLDDGEGAAPPIP